jgi:hypothetical protein
MAVDGKPSSRNRPTCLRCGKHGHVHRNCTGRNSSGAVAVIAPKGGPTVSLLGPEDVRAKAQEVTNQTVIQRCRKVKHMDSSSGTIQI